MRKIIFANNEYYHIYNQGTDKRNIFSDVNDLNRIFQSLIEFNITEPIGSIYENSFRKKANLNDQQLGNLVPKLEPLVDFIAYCINQNHYHFILKQVSDKGIEKFMHKFGLGYTNYFNKKYNRNGSLFQGTYKSIHINSNEYLLHLSAYINLNDKVHKLGNLVSKSSWDEYVYNQKGLCDKDIILGQFSSIEQYKNFAEKSLQDIIERRDIEKMLLE